MNPIDLYVKDLVPTAQMLMLLGDLYSNITRLVRSSKCRTLRGGCLTSARIRVQLMGDAFDTLNLVNCEVQSWQGKSETADQGARLLQISTAIKPLRQRLRATFDSWVALTGAPADTLVSAVLSRRNRIPYRAGFAVQDIVQSMLKMLDELDKWRAPIHAAIGYEPSERQAWLAARTRSNTSLLRNRRTSVWRTLPDNMEWTRTCEFLGLSVAVAPEKPWRFGSDMGRSRLRTLLQDAFPMQVVSPGVETVTVPPTVAERIEDGPIPDAIDVQRTADGYLAVTARAPKVTVPKTIKATNAELTSFTAKAGYDLAASEQFVCGPSGLTAALSKASAWLSKQEDLQREALKAFEGHRQKLVRERTLKKLKAFDAEELAVLADHFGKTKRH